MRKLIDTLEHYLQETLGVSVITHSWGKTGTLSPYLRERYQFFQMDLLGIKHLLMVDFEEKEQTPAVVRKHLDQLNQKGNFIYVRQSVTFYNRKRLIEKKIPFIIPGNQMYLPMLGIDLREHLKRLQEKKTVFSPATQVLILHILWHTKTEIITPFEIARKLGYSAMSLTRAFNELEVAGIGDHSLIGKERHLHPVETGKSLWEKVLPYLTNPVRKRLYVTNFAQDRNSILAGQSALAHYTTIAEPQNQILAFSAEDWKKIKMQGHVRELPAPEPEDIEIEIWKYKPSIFSDQGVVDRLSLYLSLMHDSDDRIQSALDTLLRGMKW